MVNYSLRGTATAITAAVAAFLSGTCHGSFTGIAHKSTRAKTNGRSFLDGTQIPFSPFSAPKQFSSPLLLVPPHYLHHNRRQTKALFSTAFTDSSSSSSTKTSSNSPSSKEKKSNNNSNIIASGSIVQFHSHKLYAVAAIRIQEDDVNFKKTTTTTTNKDDDDNTREEDSMLFGRPEAVSAAASSSSSNNVNNNNLHGVDFTGRLVSFQSKTTTTTNEKCGVIIAQRPPMAFVLCNFNTLDDNTNAYILDDMDSITVHDSMKGCVLDINGNHLLESKQQQQNNNTNKVVLPKEQQEQQRERPIFAPIPRVNDIALINEPLLTGITMVDALAPLGKGQNMLLIGGPEDDDDDDDNCKKSTGKRDLAIDAMTTQIRLNKEQQQQDNDNNENDQRSPVVCVYALTSSKESVRNKVLNQLEDAGIRDDVIVVSMRGNQNNDDDDDDLNNNNNNPAVAAEAVAVAATACAIGEAFALSSSPNNDNACYDAFVVIDNLDQHKYLWDWTTRLLLDVYGRDAVVKDDREGGASSEMRAFFSALVQRAARFNSRNGGKSLTLALLISLLDEKNNEEGGGEEEEEIVYTMDDFAQCSHKIKLRLQTLIRANVPINSTNLRKIEIPIPTTKQEQEEQQKRRLSLQHIDDLISMSDGQIWLDHNLYYHSGQRPSLDPQRSITRVGIGADTKSRADVPAFFKNNLAGGLRFELAHQDTTIMTGGGGSSSSLDVDRQILKRNAAWLLAMHQESGKQRRLSESCIALLAASSGVLDNVVTTTMDDDDETTKTMKNKNILIMEELLSYVNMECPNEMKLIDMTLDMDMDIRTVLESSIQNFFSLQKHK